ncbi:unnamed protein product [Symbiodinium necroappetens]|uniref:Uncharacterized protein n=1 Tax=Symbiodinium necroappetens TaxID=1628268 RepID=A0A812SR49_9DINO|nr:unnamed protein product [Symbiodinium necroappetens]
MGPAAKAEEVKLLWLQTAMDEDVSLQGLNSILSGTEGPRGGLWIWALGILFVLREVELGCLTLGCVKLDANAKKVTLCLPVSKKDPGGRGARRSRDCRCGGLRSVSCPWCVAVTLFDEQVLRLGGFEEEAPLFGTVCSARSFVAKNKMIEEAQAMASLIKERVSDAENLRIEAVTGHFMRRSGVKMLARSGVALDLIQWWSRHSSAAILGYVEEAMEECPEGKDKLQSYLSFQEQLAAMSTETGTLKDMALQIAVRVDNLEKGSLCDFDVAELKSDLESWLTPEFVVSVRSKKIHSTRGCNFRKPPLEWTTVCGWPFNESGRMAKPMSRERFETSKHERCARCFP